MKIITRIQDDAFNKNVVPSIVKIKSMVRLKELYKYTKGKLPMKKFLWNNYHLVLDDVVKVIDRYFIAHNCGGIITIEIDPLEKINGFNLLSIVQLIDNGNMNVKGIHLVDLSMKYLQSQINLIYKVYMKGGLHYGN